MTSRSVDPLLSTLGADSRVRADRLHYSTGELLGADDFAAEQTYHRRQLARALVLLHGCGSVAGLAVTIRPTLADTETTPREVTEAILEVGPGLAIDRVGRLIEVPRPHGLRLRRWFDRVASAVPAFTPEDEDDQQDLLLAFHPDPAGPAGSGFVVADVFLRFHECDWAPSPAFATGPFDALDASQPSRTRDAHELKWVLRKESDALTHALAERPFAFDPWAESVAAAAAAADTSAAATFRSLRQSSLTLWNALQPPNLPAENAWHEYPPFIDRTSVLLARVRLPATRTSATSVPQVVWTEDAWPPARELVNNAVRNFVIPPVAAIRAAPSISA